MRIRTDDDIYRVDAVWLGPPRATFPWRATYASYLVGFLIFLFVLFVQRRIGIAFNILPTAWALVITVFVTRLIARKVNYEKGVVHLFQHFWWEVTGPRLSRGRRGGGLRTGHVRIRRQLPRSRSPKGSRGAQAELRATKARSTARPARSRLTSRKSASRKSASRTGSAVWSRSADQPLAAGPAPQPRSAAQSRAAEQSRSADKSRSGEHPRPAEQVRAAFRSGSATRARTRPRAGSRRGGR